MYTVSIALSLDFKLRSECSAFFHKEAYWCHATFPAGGLPIIVNNKIIKLFVKKLDYIKIQYYMNFNQS